MKKSGFTETQIVSILKETPAKFPFSYSSFVNVYAAASPEIVFASSI